MWIWGNAREFQKGEVRQWKIKDLNWQQDPDRFKRSKKSWWWFKSLLKKEIVESQSIGCFLCSEIGSNSESEQGESITLRFTILDFVYRLGLLQIMQKNSWIRIRIEENREIEEIKGKNKENVWKGNKNQRSENRGFK